MNYVECIPGKASGQLIIAWFSAMMIAYKWIMFVVTRQKTSALTIGDAQALRCHMYSLTPVENVLNDIESGSFTQSEKLRCMNHASESLESEST